MPNLTSTTLGRFCRELAGGLDDIPTLLAEWGIDQTKFEALQRSPAFQQEMRLVQAEMAELGNDAGYIYRMKSLSESLLPDFIKLLQDSATSSSLKFEMIKWAAEMGRLKEKPAAKTDAAISRGPAVVFRFGPGLPVQSMTVHTEGAPEIMGESHEIMRLPEAVDVVARTVDTEVDTPPTNDAFWPT